jgi:hypothetical protein
MTIEVASIQPRDQLKKIFVTVFFHDELKTPHNSARVEVFIDHADSYAEIRKRAVAAACEFLTEALAAAPKETAEK